MNKTNFQSRRVRRPQQGGFTLIEILVVIGIIAILALIVLVAINPARQFAQSRNTQRTANVEAILNAIGQNMVDNKGVFNCATDIPTGAISTSTAVRIESSSTLGFNSANDYDIAPCLVPIYISSLPFDPGTTTPAVFYNSTSSYDTAYYVYRDSNGRVGVCAPTIETNLNNSEICAVR